MRAKRSRWSLLLIFVAPLAGCENNPSGPDASALVKAQTEAKAAPGKKAKKQEFNRQVSPAD